MSGMIQSPRDYDIDRDVGFTIIEAHEIDDIGMDGIIHKTRSIVRDTPTYLSIDIDGMKSVICLLHILLSASMLT